MNRNVVSLKSEALLNFEPSQGESTKQGSEDQAFYQTARLNISIFNPGDNEWEHLTSFEVISGAPLPSVDEIHKEISSSLGYKLAYCSINEESLGRISQHALSLLAQEHQRLSPDPIPENQVTRAVKPASVIEQLIR